MMDAITDPSLSTVVYYTSARIGKTSLLENAIGYHVDRDPCPIMMVQTTEQDAMDWSKDNLVPMIRDTPCLQEKIKESRAKTGDNTIVHKKFPGGYVRIVGANSPRGFRRVTIRLLLLDEVDGYPTSSGPEGDPLELAKKRVSTVWNSMTVIASTPTIKKASRIEDEWNLSDKRHYFVPCPKCGHKQILIFGPRSQFADLAKGYLKFDEHNLSWVCYVCESCQAELSEVDKLRMVANGEWTRTAPEVKRVGGFHLNELYSTFIKWEDVARRFVEAKHDREKLRVWVNQSLGETFELEEAYSVSNEMLAARMEHYDPYKGEIPEKVVVLTCGVDVQKDRVEVQLDGWGPGEESWLLDHVMIQGVLSDQETRAALDEYLYREWKRTDGVALTVAATFMDSGGDQTQDVYKYCKPRFRRRIMATKGVGGMGRPLVGKVTRNNKEGAFLVPLGVDDAKRITYDRLETKEPGPKFRHFNHSATDEYFRQLTAEEKVRVLEKGQPKLIWRLRKGQRRNEALDLTVYSLCAMRSLNVNWVKLGENLKKKTNAESAQEGPPDEVATPPIQKTAERFVRKSNFVSSWRKRF